MGLFWTVPAPGALKDLIPPGCSLHARPRLRRAVRGQAVLPALPGCRHGWWLCGGSSPFLTLPDILCFADTIAENPEWVLTGPARYVPNSSSDPPSLLLKGSEPPPPPFTQHHGGTEPPEPRREQDRRPPGALCPSGGRPYEHDEVRRAHGLQALGFAGAELLRVAALGHEAVHAPVQR